MNATPLQPALQRAVRATCGCASADGDPAVAAVLATSRDYFALAAETIEATRTGVAAARRR